MFRGPGIGGEVIHWIEGKISFWAIHCEGCTPRTLAFLLETYGFAVVKTSRNKWKGTHNFEVTAKRAKGLLSWQVCVKKTEAYLSNYLIDRSQSEIRLLEIWMEAYNRQLDVSWAGDG